MLIYLCLSCDSHKLDQMQAQLNSVLGLHRTISRDSIVSFAGSINTKKAYKKFCKGLYEIGVTAKMISEKEKEIRAIFTATNQGNSAIDQSGVPELGDSSDVETSPGFTTSTENTPGRRFGWARPPVDFLVGPLMLTAAVAGDTKRLISTLRFVRNINFVDDQTGETALHKAIAGGHQEMVQLLCAKGASFEAIDKNGFTPLKSAASNGHTSTVELLLSKGASIEASTHICRLHGATSNGHTITVKFLLPKGTSTETMRLFCSTSLHLSAGNGHTRTVELLLSKGALVDSKDHNKGTPLHDAASNGHTGTVELLLSKVLRLILRIITPTPHWNMLQAMVVPVQ